MSLGCHRGRAVLVGSSVGAGQRLRHLQRSRNSIGPGSQPSQDRSGTADGEWPAGPESCLAWAAGGPQALQVLAVSSVLVDVLIPALWRVLAACLASGTEKNGSEERKTPSQRWG